MRSRMSQGLLKSRVDWAIVLSNKTGSHTQTLPVDPHKSPWPCPSCEHAKHVMAFGEVRDCRWKVVEVVPLYQLYVEAFVVCHCRDIMEPDVEALFCQSCH